MLKGGARSASEALLLGVVVAARVCGAGRFVVAVYQSMWRDEHRPRPCLLSPFVFTSGVRCGQYPLSGPQVDPGRDEARHRPGVRGGL